MNQRTIAFLLLSMLAGSVGRAETLVHWGGDSVTGSRNMVLPATTTSGGTVTYAYSGTTALTPSSGYSPPADRSGAFFGALENISNDGTPRNLGAARVSNNLTDDFLYVQGNSGVPGTVRGLFFFPKAGFLAGGSDAIALGGVSGSLEIRTLSATGSFRFAVQNGSQWYVSESQRTATGLFDLADFAGETWAAWDPATTPIDPLPTTFSTSGGTLADIQAFGFTFSASRGDSTPSVSIEEFMVVAVPEPAAGLLAAMGIVGLVAISCRRVFVHRRPNDSRLRLS
jgi:hypothetical protein